MAFKMKYGKGSFPYKSGSALKTHEEGHSPRSKIRQLRDQVKDDYYDVPRGSHYKGVKQDVIGERKTKEELNPKESMIEMAARLKAEKEARNKA